MPSKLSVIAVANSAAVQQQLQEQLALLPYVDFHGEILLEMATTVEWWQSKQPDVIIIDLTDREVDGNLFIEAITLNPTKPCAVFALHQQLDHQLILNAIRAGAKEFVQYPADASALNSAFDRMWRQYCLIHNPEAHKEKLIVVYGNKGGMGATTIAVNLAVEFQLASQSPVCLLDADQNFCNTSGWLNLSPTHSLSDLAKSGTGGVDDTLLNQLLTHHESGLSILYGCHNVEDTSPGGLPQHLWEPLLDSLRNKFRTVIVDLPSRNVDPVHQWLVDQADHVLMVSQIDVLSLFQTRQYLELVRQHMPIEKFQLIINRSGQKGAFGITDEQLLSQFQYPVFAKVTNDWNLMLEAISLGKPLRLVNPKAQIVRDIQLIYQLLTQESGKKSTDAASKPSSNKNNWLNKLLKRG
jgi:pilus assembly protein CpaE